MYPYCILQCGPHEPEFDFEIRSPLKLDWKLFGKSTICVFAKWFKTEWQENCKKILVKYSFDCWYFQWLSWQNSYYFTASFSSMWLMHERLSLPAAVWGRVSPDDRWSRDYGSMTSKRNHLSPVFVQFASCHGINGMTALPVKAAHRYILCSYTKYRSWA